MPIDPAFQHLLDHAGALVYLAVLVSFVVVLRVPLVYRRRLRPVFWGAVIFTVVATIARRVTDPVDHQDLAALRFLVTGLTLVRFGYVLVVDLAVERAGRRPLNALFRDVLEFGAYITVGVVALHMANLRAGSLIAGGTVVTAVLGLSLQDTIGNLAAGIAIQLERPAQTGDWVQVDKTDVLGRVIAMNWRAVTLETDAATHFVVPNSVFAKTPFTNFSRPDGGTRRSFYVTVPHEVPPHVVTEALLAACHDCAEIMTSPSASVFPWEVTDRGVTYWLRFWIADFRTRDHALAELTRLVWYQFNRRKIAFATPVRRTFTQKLSEKSRLVDQEEVLRDRRAAIDGVDFLDPLSDKSKQMLAEKGHRRLYVAGETIIAQGDNHRSFYIVRYGEVAVRIDGHQVHCLGAGDFFGEMGLLTGEPRRATIQATMPTEVFEIDEPMFRTVLEDEPAIAGAMAPIVAKRQAELEQIRASNRGESARTDGGLSATILARVKEVFGLG